MPGNGVSVTIDRGGIRQAGAVPFEVSPSGRVRVLLITSRSGRWSFPKGTIEGTLSEAQTAQREALEEAGVMGVPLLPRLARVSYQKSDLTHRVGVYALPVTEVMDRWPEESMRQRRWASVAEARRLVSRAWVLELLGGLSPRLLKDLVARGAKGEFVGRDLRAALRG